MTLSGRPADSGDGRLASLRTISSLSGVRVLFIYNWEGEGLSVVLTNGGAGLLTGCWLTVAHLVGRRSAVGYGISWPSRTVIASVCLRGAREGRAPHALGPIWDHCYRGWRVDTEGADLYPRGLHLCWELTL